MRRNNGAKRLWRRPVGLQTYQQMTERTRFVLSTRRAQLFRKAHLTIVVGNNVRTAVVYVSSLQPPSKPEDAGSGVHSGLKQRLLYVWYGMEQCIIDSVINR